jgi:hypothetical protein
MPRNNFVNGIFGMENVFKVFTYDLEGSYRFYKTKEFKTIWG